MSAKPTGAAHWADLQLLLDVARAGSLLGAARARGLAASTLSRRMTKLETAVGTPLVVRGPSGVELSDAAAQLVTAARQFGLAVASAVRDLGATGRPLSGVVRITAGHGFAELIAGVIARFQEEHPAVRFEVALEERLVDLVRREADVAIRTVHRHEGTLVYLRAGELAYGLFAHADYVARRGRPRVVAELERHAIVGLAPPHDAVPAVRAFEKLFSVVPVARTTFPGQLAATRAGVGIAVLPALAAAGLAPVLPQLALPSLPVWLVVHRDVRARPAVDAVVRALRAAFA